MNVRYSYIECKNALSTSRLPGLRYSLNPYAGCEHGCLYCYAQAFSEVRSKASGWGSFVKTKHNIVDALLRQLPSLPVGPVGVSTITDPYQPLEAKHGLTRRCIEILASSKFHVSIQTKSALVLRDIDIIFPGKFDFGVTITTLDADLARKLQPRASSPEILAEVVEEFAARGVPTWVFLGPIVPELSDSTESIRKVIEVAKKSNSELIYDKLNLRPFVLRSLTPLLEMETPGLVGRLPELVKQGSLYWRGLRSKIEHLCRDLGVKCKSAFP